MASYWDVDGVDDISGRGRENVRGLGLELVVERMQREVGSSRCKESLICSVTINA